MSYCRGEIIEARVDPDNMGSKAIDREEENSGRKSGPTNKF